MALIPTDLIMLTELKVDWDKLPVDLPTFTKVEWMIGPARNHWMVTDMQRQQYLLLEFVAARLKEKDPEEFQAFVNVIELLTNPQQAMAKIQGDDVEMEERMQLATKYGQLLPKNWNELWTMPREDLDAYYRAHPLKDKQPVEDVPDGQGLPAT